MPDWLDVSVFGLTLFVMLVGLIGLIVPVFPGIVVIWLAALGYGIVTGFTRLAWLIFAALTVLMLVGVLVDNVMMGAKARQTGASWWSIGLALLAGIVGTVLWPPVGGLVAALLSLFLAEYARLGDWDRAFQASRGLALGCGWAFVIRFGIGVVMIALWGAWAFFG